MLDSNNTVLFVIDVQDKLVNMLKNSDEISRNNEILTKAAKILDLPVILTEQYPKGLGYTLSSIRENVDNNNIFEKTSFSALDNIDVLNKIKEYNPKNIILTGIEAHICVYQTALALLENGYEVYVVKNAVSSRNLKDCKTGLELMRDFGAKLTCVETVLFELLKTSKHPNFKEVQALIK